MWKDCLSIQVKVQTVEENDNVLNYWNLKNQETSQTQLNISFI